MSRYNGDFVKVDMWYGDNEKIGAILWAKEDI